MLTLGSNDNVSGGVGYLIVGGEDLIAGMAKAKNGKGDSGIS